MKYLVLSVAAIRLGALKFVMNRVFWQGRIVMKRIRLRCRPSQ